MAVQVDDVSRTIAAIGSAMNAPEEAGQLAAEQQREDHQQRVDAQRLAEHVRRHDVALELLQDREGDDQPHGVERVAAERGDHHRRERADRRADVRDQLGEAEPAPKATAYVLPSGKIPSEPSTHSISPALVPMIRLNRNWPRT